MDVTIEEPTERQSHARQPAHSTILLPAMLETTWRRPLGAANPYPKEVESESPLVGFIAFGVFLLSPVMSIQYVEAQEATALRGDPAAITDAEAMVEAIGELAIWRELEVVHFVHEWDIYNRPDIYLENEVLDLTGPRSYVTMESEIYTRIRVQSRTPLLEHCKREFSYASDQAFDDAME